jgi:hypothetical protein
MRSKILVLAVALLLAGAIVSAMTFSRRQELLVHAATRGDAAIAKALLTIGADPNSKATGSTPLYAAAWAGRVEAAECLLDAGAAVDSTDAKDMTALMAAVGRGDDAMAKLLLARGANVNAVACCGSPLDIALTNRAESTARLLEASGGKRAAELENESAGVTP